MPEGRYTSLITCKIGSKEGIKPSLANSDG